MTKFDSYYFIYKNVVGDWNITNQPRFIARHTHCRAIDKNKVRDLKQLYYICNKLSSELDTFTKRYLIKELEII